MKYPLGLIKFKRSEFLNLLQEVTDKDTAENITKLLEREQILPIWFKDYHCLCSGKREYINEEKES